MELQVANQPAPGRSCTDIGCAYCCKVVSIKFPDGEHKPMRKWCKHCTKPGCGIYDERPDVCRDFHCTWLADPQWPVELDPISTGCMVMCETITGTDRNTGETFDLPCIRVHENRPGAIENINAALRMVWNSLGKVGIALHTTNGLIRIIGFNREGQRVVFFENKSSDYGDNQLPTVTRKTLDEWGGDWRALRARCAQDFNKYYGDSHAPDE